MKLSPNLDTFIFGLVILFSGIILVPKVHAGNLTAPLSPPLSINSYFDHSQPGFVGGMPIINNNISIFTGTTTTSSNGVCGYLFGQPVAYYAGPGGAGNCIWYEGHDGIDFQAASGTPIFAAALGTATAVTWDNCGGNYIRLWHSKLGYSTRYFHLSKALIATSTVVNQLQQIATSGGTGACTTGPHLHFDIRNAKDHGQPVDPYGWSGSGSDPWSYDQGYLWTTNPPSLTVLYTSVSGTIAQNTIWTATGSPYLITSNVTVNPGVILKINPGVVVKFQTYTRMDVFGTLNASTTYPGGHNGTVEFPGANSKIYFTSYKDDSVGGDTNGDGNMTLPAVADYSGIYFYPGSTGNFNNVDVRYGGYSGCCPIYYGAINNLGGTINITSSTIEKNKYGFLQKVFTSNTKIDGTVFKDNADYGMYFGSSVYSTSTVVVTNSGFNNNGIADGYFQGSTNFINSGNYNFGSAPRGFWFSISTVPSQTWNPGVPFITDWLIVDKSETLTLNPGVIIKFKPLLGYSKIDVAGKLISAGASSSKVYFTSFRDDSLGGDTNGDATSSVPSIGDYQGFYFYSGSSGVINDSYIAYGGYLSCTNCHGWAINNFGGKVIINNSILDKNFNGVIESGYPGSGSMVIDSSVFTDNLDYGFYAYSTSTSTVPVISVTNSGFNNNKLGDGYIYGTVNFNNYGNYFTSSTTRGILIGSYQYIDTVLNPGIPFVINYDLFVGSGFSLTLNPGTIVKFKSDIIIYGNLYSSGTPNNLVYLTSYLDDSLAGDTNGDGSVTVPAPGNYDGIFFYPGGSGTFVNSEIKYGGWPNICCPVYLGAIKNIGSTVNIVNSRLHLNGDGIGQYNGGTTTVVQSSLHDNTGNGIFNYSNSSTTAITNWWGDPTGPYHPTMNPNGKGDKVSNLVDFIPWLTSDPN